MVVSEAEGMSVGASDPELVAGFLGPKCGAYGSAVFDHDACFGSSVYGEDAHWNFVDARDPNHCELARLCVVERGVGEPE